MTLPALLTPALGFDAPNAHVTERTQRPAVHAPSPTPTPTPTPTPKASGLVKATPMTTPAPTPVRSTARAATPAPAPAIQAAATEIASEQVCPGQGDVSKTPAVLTCLTAKARVFHGLKAVSANSALMAAAAAKNQDMLKCGYGHTACGHAFNYQMTAHGYAGRCTAENIAMGQRTPREVFVAWMNSPGHRANILNAQYNAIGVAELASSKGPLWTMELGGC
jgi:uncharacterized protein YkwD